MPAGHMTVHNIVLYMDTYLRKYVHSSYLFTSYYEYFIIGKNERVIS